MFNKILTHKLTLPLLLLLGLALRTYGVATPAQPYDIGTYQAWATHLLAVGPQNFFGSIWSDYLPLPILTFSLPLMLANLTSLDFALVFKTFHTLIELALILGLTFLHKPPQHLRFFLLLFLSPALLGNTSYWGQVDSLPTLLTLLALTLLVESPLLTPKRTLLSALLYGLAVAYKPIMLLISPILWVVSIKRGRWWQFPLISGTTFFLTALPFVKAPWEVIGFLWHRAIEQAGTYPYLSINAWNLWTLTGNTAWLPDHLSVLGISGRTFGLAVFFLSFFTLAKFWKTQHWAPRLSYLLSALVLIIFYTFTTRMHERHLLFGLPFLAASTLFVPRLLWSYLLLTLAYILNLYGAFVWVLQNQVWPFPTWVIRTVSYTTVLTVLTLFVHTIYPGLILHLKLLARSHRTLLLILGLASLLRLVNLSHPPAYIFDEVYHGFTAKEYLHNHVEAWQWWTTPPEGVAYEWTHPPVAKYGMVLGMLLLGEGELGYRVGSAVMGVLGILGLYLFVSTLTKNQNLALLSAFLMTIEGTHLAQSRVAMNDTYMLTFYLWSLVAAVKSRYKLMAVLYGLALGSKWSALYGALPLALIYLHSAALKPTFTSFVRPTLFALRLILITLAVYILTFTPFILAGHTWAQWWELHRQMWYYHTNLVATHAYQSTPLQWVFAARPVWYWVEYGTGVVSHLYVHANPLILWLGLFALVMQLPTVRRYPSFVLYLLYFIFFVPWIFSPRIMFYYHYLPSATFLLPILASWLLTLPKKMMYLSLFTLTLSLLLVSPMLYGFPLPSSYWSTFFTLFPNWK